MSTDLWQSTIYQDWIDKIIMAMEIDPDIYNEILRCDEIAKHEGKTIYQVIWEIQSSIRTHT